MRELDQVFDLLDERVDQELLNDRGDLAIEVGLPQGGLQDLLAHGNRTHGHDQVSTDLRQRGGADGHVRAGAGLSVRGVHGWCLFSRSEVICMSEGADTPRESARRKIASKVGVRNPRSRSEGYVR